MIVQRKPDSWLQLRGKPAVLLFFIVVSSIFPALEPCVCSLFMPRCCLRLPPAARLFTSVSSSEETAEGCIIENSIHLCVCCFLCAFVCVRLLPMAFNWFIEATCCISPALTSFSSVQVPPPPLPDVTDPWKKPCRCSRQEQVGHLFAGGGAAALLHLSTFSLLLRRAARDAGPADLSAAAWC